MKFAAAFLLVAALSLWVATLTSAGTFDPAKSYQFIQTSTPDPQLSATITADGSGGAEVFHMTSTGATQGVQYDFDCQLTETTKTGERNHGVGSGAIVPDPTGAITVGVWLGGFLRDLRIGKTVVTCWFRDRADGHCCSLPFTMTDGQPAILTGRIKKTSG